MAVQVHHDINARKSGIAPAHSFPEQSLLKMQKGSVIIPSFLQTEPTGYRGKSGIGSFPCVNKEPGY